MKELSVVVANELSIPGKDLISIVRELLDNADPVEVFTMLLKSEVFIHRNSSHTRIMMLPMCTCEGCLEIKEQAKQMLREGSNPEEVHKAIESLTEDFSNRGINHN